MQSYKYWIDDHTIIIIDLDFEDENNGAIKARFQNVCVIVYIDSMDYDVTSSFSSDELDRFGSKALESFIKEYIGKKDYSHDNQKS